jgi:hypothetical protein
MNTLENHSESPRSAGLGCCTYCGATVRLLGVLALILFGVAYGFSLSQCSRSAHPNEIPDRPVLI